MVESWPQTDWLPSQGRSENAKKIVIRTPAARWSAAGGNDIGGWERIQFIEMGAYAEELISAV
jgi:hypothetical protein